MGTKSELNLSERILVFRSVGQASYRRKRCNTGGERCIISHSHIVQNRAQMDKGKNISANTHVRAHRHLVYGDLKARGDNLESPDLTRSTIYPRSHRDHAHGVPAAEGAHVTAPQSENRRAMSFSKLPTGQWRTAIATIPPEGSRRRGRD
jgi:hypothetical protein